MSGFCSMFSQLLKLFPRAEFQALVKRTHAERHARGFTCWGQFVAMLLRSRFAWSLSNLVALLRMNLFTHRDLWRWLEPFEGPPTILVAAQGELALA